MNEAVDGGNRHGRIGKDVVPGAERLVGGDQQGAALVAGADQLEQHAGFGLALLDVGEVVEDQQVVLVELLDRDREPELLARRLQLLDEVGGAREQHAVAGVDQRVAESRGEMISYGLPRPFPGQAVTAGRHRRLAIRISAGTPNRSATMALPSATLMGVPSMSRSS